MQMERELPQFRGNTQMPKPFLNLRNCDSNAVVKERSIKF